MSKKTNSFFVQVFTLSSMCQTLSKLEFANSGGFGIRIGLWIQRQDDGFKINLFLKVLFLDLVELLS
jgi:hypothetical protein